MKDPIGDFETLKKGIKRYITSAFGTNSVSFEKERRGLLDQSGVLFQTPYVEPIPLYKPGKTLEELTEKDLPSLNDTGRTAFRAIVSAGLFNGGYPLYVHQQEMWTSQTLLDTFNSYNVTYMRGFYEQRQTVYRRV